MTLREFIYSLLCMTIGNPAIGILFHFLVTIHVSILVLRLSHGRVLSVFCGFAGTVAALLIGYGLQFVSEGYNDLIMAPYLDWQILAPRKEDILCFVIFTMLPFIIASSICALRRRQSPTGVREHQGMRSSDRALCWLAIVSVPLSTLGDISGSYAENLFYNRIVQVAFAIVGSLRLWRKTKSDREWWWARLFFLLTTCYAIHIAFVGWKAM